MTQLTDFSDDELLALPLDRLGSLTLAHCAASQEWNSHNFILNAGNGRGAAACMALSEAMNWLVANGLIARDKPGQTSAQSIFVTRTGRQALEDGVELVVAGARLNTELRPRLAKVRSQFLLGDFELAAFAAMREVEIRVRELAGASPSLLGVKLMREAFKPDGGPLSNADLDPGERVGLMELFAGAIGTFKNPPSHRQADYANATEASEVVMLADLLMRILDRY